MSQLILLSVVALCFALPVLIAAFWTSIFFRR